MDKPWKVRERKIAKLFNTYRNPLSGAASRHTSSDTLHPDYYIEIKTGRSWDWIKPKYKSLFKNTNNTGYLVRDGFIFGSLKLVLNYLVTHRCNLIDPTDSTLGLRSSVFNLLDDISEKAKAENKHTAILVICPYNVRTMNSPAFVRNSLCGIS